MKRQSQNMGSRTSLRIGGNMPDPLHITPPKEDCDDSIPPSKAMASRVGDRNNGPLKTYSRRDNHKVEDVPSRKRKAGADLPATTLAALPSQAKKIKRTSIESYFKPIQIFNPTTISSTQTSSDPPDLHSTPPSSPPSINGSVIARRSTIRPRRRLQTRPALTPIANMASAYDYDDEDTTFQEVAESGDHDARISAAEACLDREDLRDAQLSRMTGGSATERSIQDHNRQHLATTRQFHRHEESQTLPHSRPLQSHSPSRTSSSTLLVNSTQQAKTETSLQATTARRDRRVATLLTTDDTNPSSSRTTLMSRTSSAVQDRVARLFSRATSTTLVNITGPVNDSAQLTDTPSEPIDIPKPPPKKNNTSGYTQLHLDLGLEVLVECKVCGMAYNRTVKKDMRAHEKHHEQFIKGKQPARPSKIDIIDNYIDGTQWRLRASNRDLSLVWRQYFEQALERTYEDLPGLKLDNNLLWSTITIADGGTSVEVPRYRIFVMLEGLEVVGVVLAERVEKGVGYKGPLTGDEVGKVRKVYMSVDRIWVKEDLRRQHIATILVDNARALFVDGRHLSRKEVAFSPPTVAGAEFAGKYCKYVFGDCPFLINMGDVVGGLGGGEEGAVEGGI